MFALVEVEADGLNFHMHIYLIVARGLVQCNTKYILKLYWDLKYTKYFPFQSWVFTNTYKVDSKWDNAGQNTYHNRYTVKASHSQRRLILRDIHWFSQNHNISMALFKSHLIKKI